MLTMQNGIIQSPRFARDTLILMSNFVVAGGELDVMVSAREELISTNTPMWLLMAKLDEMGGVDYVMWMLSGGRGKHKWRVFANKLFQGAPPTGQFLWRLILRIITST
jgi:hypothetical protein